MIATEATAGVLPDCDDFALALKSGRVEAHLLKQGQETIGAKIRCPQSLHVYEERDSELLANCLGIPSSTIRLDRVPPSVASVGLPFTFVHLQDKSWLSKISLHRESRLKRTITWWVLMDKKFLVKITLINFLMVQLVNKQYYILIKKTALKMHGKLL